MRIVVGTVAVLLASSAFVATAQTYFPYPAPYAGGGGSYYHHASTVEEGAARGMADVIRSSGSANLMNSAAAINYEDARSKYINNRMQATNTYFEMRRVNEQSRAAERSPPPTQEQAIRFAKDKLPDRPKATQVDPLTGGINWPSLLQVKGFDADRKKLEDLYAIRANKGQLTAGQYVAVRDTTESMKRELRKLAPRVPGNMSIEARKFLDSLSYEAQFQAG